MDLHTKRLKDDQGQSHIGYQRQQTADQSQSNGRVKSTKLTIKTNQMANQSQTRLTKILSSKPF